MSDDRPQTSRRDRAALVARLTAWLSERVDTPLISPLDVPPTTGMSSETLLFDVTYRNGDGVVVERCVARLPPDPGDDPVFPHYDMAMQYKVMELVGRRTTAPVPEMLWLEPDPAPLGVPFFVMRMVDGWVPPDVMPYTFGDNVLFDAAASDQRRLQDETVGVLAAIHTIGADDESLGFVSRPAAGVTALAHHVDGWQRYYRWVRGDGEPLPVAEAAFEHLWATWPNAIAERGDDVLSWGDARIGNVLYQGFSPAAVLDWEMAGVGPRHIDVAWMVFLHRFFDDLAVGYGFAGIPGFMRAADVLDAYAAASGVRIPIAELHWFVEYAAWRHAVVMYRIARRRAGFGELVMPEDLDTTVPHAESLRSMIAGTYWEKL